MRAVFLLIGLVLASGCGSGGAGWRSGAPRPGPRPATTAPSRPALDADALARQIHRETNLARRRNGFAPLDWNPRLVPAANGHSRDMARRGFFDHVSPDGLDANDRAGRAGAECRARLSRQRERVGVLENLYKTSRWTEWTERTVGGRTTRDYAWQSPEAITRAVVTGWLNSPGHRRNLLDPTARSEAVAVAFARDDSVYITQLLC